MYKTLLVLYLWINYKTAGKAILCIIELRNLWLTVVSNLLPWLCRGGWKHSPELPRATKIIYAKSVF